MRILILSPNQINRYNWGHQLFRNEIGKQHNVLYYGEGFPKFNSKETVPELIKRSYGNSYPDLIITYGYRYSIGFQGLGQIKNVPKVHIVCDYGRPQGIPKQNKFMRENEYDMLFAITQNAERLLNKNLPEFPTRIIPFSVDTNIYKSNNVKKENMVLASYNARKDVYPNRQRLRIILKKMGIKTYSKKAIHQSLINMINRSKITVTSNNIFRSLSMRYTETLACGGFLLADEPEDLGLVGLKDGEHLVIYKDLKDFEDKVRYYMDHNKERNRIAKQGMEFVRKNHSCEQRVKEITQHIKEVLGI